MPGLFEGTTKHARFDYLKLLLYFALRSALDYANSLALLLLFLLFSSSGCLCKKSSLCILHKGF